MKAEAQRIAIAGACGWTDIKLEEIYVDDQSTADRWTGRQPDMIGACACEIPDFLNDLNAMHEAEKTLQGAKIVQYIGYLMGVTEAECMEDHREVFVVANATAAQRAEAFLRTVGKLEESA